MELSRSSGSLPRAAGDPLGDKSLLPLPLGPNESAPLPFILGVSLRQHQSRQQLWLLGMGIPPPSLATSVSMATIFRLLPGAQHLF